MSEPEPRPSWMPSARLIGAAVSIDSSERAWDSCAPVRTERVDRLLLATGLRAQIEALEMYGAPDLGTGLALADARARLAELEGV